MAKKAVKKSAKQTSRYADANMNPVVHFEFPMEDAKRAAKFYKQVFGWHMMTLGEEQGGYMIAHTGETDSEGMLREKGIINGGFYDKKQRKQPKHPTVVIAVYDLNKAMKKIEKAGGKIVSKPETAQGYGTYVSFRDSEGNVATMIEPDEDWKQKTI